MPLTKYLCYKCKSFETCRFTELKRHILRKKKCNFTMETMLISNDQVLVMSLMPYNDNKHSIEINNLEHLCKSNIMSDNNELLFNDILSIDKNNTKICKYCNEKFNLVSDLKKHYIVDCFYKNIFEHNTINTTINKDSNNIITNSHNITNTTNNNNNNINNLNLFLDLKFPSPVPFEDSWNLSQISDETKSKILISKYIYSELLNEVLNNDINNNVIIDKDSKNGYVYMNHNDKYISMKTNIIAEKTMEKLNKNLIDINDELKDNINETVYKVVRNTINDKHNLYNNNKDLKKNIDSLLCGIYNGNMEKSLKISENVKKINNIKQKILSEYHENEEYTEYRKRLLNEYKNGIF